jgi:hypothetical protein
VAAGLRITLKAASLDGKMHRETSELTIKGNSGWISAAGIEPGTMQYVPDGVLNYFEATGNITLDVNGAAETIRPTDRWVARGAFRSRNDEESKIRLYGVANELTKDQVRKNPTKFENAHLLDFLGVFGPSLLIFGGTLLLPFRKRFASNSPFTWRLPSQRIA